MHALEKKKTIKIGLVSRKRLYGILENNNHSLIVSTLNSYNADFESLV